MTKIYRILQNSASQSIYPVLTKHEGEEYRYRSVKRHLKDISTIPYDFIIAILKEYVYTIDANHSMAQRGESGKILLIAKSNREEYAVAVLMSMENYLMTIHDIQKVPLYQVSEERMNLYPDIPYHYFESLDLDAYLKKITQIKETYIQKHRKKALKQTEQFYGRRGYQYRYKISQHAYTKRSHSKGVRLTLPLEAVKDVLKYLVKNENAYEQLQKQLKYVKDEKQIALIFYNRGRTHLLGLLVAFDVSLDDMMVVTVVTMLDDVPKDRSAQRLLFPKVDRIALYDYDLGAFMEEYNREQKQKELEKEERLKKRLQESTAKQEGIVKVSSLDEYYDNNMHIKRANTTVTTHRRKIRKVKVEKPVFIDKETLIVKQQQKQVTMSKRSKVSALMHWMKTSFKKIKELFSRFQN